MNNYDNCNAFLISLCITLSSQQVLGSLGFNEIDQSRYMEGKTQYELLHTHSKLPAYGKCWTNAISLLEQGCKKLTAEMQSRLALAYLNCFLKVQGRKPYKCDDDMSNEDCMSDLNDSDRSSLTTFFTHTQNICYFLESHVWHEHTTSTIHKLSRNSKEVAEQLDATTKLQKEALKNQELILDKASNLSETINSSSENLHSLISDFRKTTDEQKLLINDIFDRLVRLQGMVLGEFSGFYSIVYYAISIVMCWFLTSAPRTAAARFWLFGLVTVNFIAERVIVASQSHENLGLAVADAHREELIYSSHSLCRKVSGMIGLIFLIISAMRYRDLNAVNNQLLLNIKRQNSELKQILGRVYSVSPSSYHVDEPDNMLLSTSRAAADTTGYESDSAVNSCSEDLDSSSDIESDHSYLPTVEESDKDDYSTPPSSYSESIDPRETEFLRHSTPIKDFGKRIQLWAKTGFYNVTSSSDNDSSSSLPSNSQISPRRYNLRQRTLTQITNPALREESPRTFKRNIKNLEKIALQNSLYTRGILLNKINCQSPNADTS